MHFFYLNKKIVYDQIVTDLLVVLQCNHLKDKTPNYTLRNGYKMNQIQEVLQLTKKDEDYLQDNLKENINKFDSLLPKNDYQSKEQINTQITELFRQIKNIICAINIKKELPIRNREQYFQKVDDKNNATQRSAKLFGFFLNQNLFPWLSMPSNITEYKPYRKLATSLCDTFKDYLILLDLPPHGFLSRKELISYAEKDDAVANLILARPPHFKYPNTRYYPSELKRKFVRNFSNNEVKYLVKAAKLGQIAANDILFDDFDPRNTINLEKHGYNFNNFIDILKHEYEENKENFSINVRLMGVYFKDDLIKVNNRHLQYLLHLKHIPDGYYDPEKGKLHHDNIKDKKIPITYQLPILLVGAFILFDNNHDEFDKKINEIISFFKKNDLPSFIVSDYHRSFKVLLDKSPFSDLNEKYKSNFEMADSIDLTEIKSNFQIKDVFIKILTKELKLKTSVEYLGLENLKPLSFIDANLQHIDFNKPADPFTTFIKTLTSYINKDKNDALNIISDYKETDTNKYQRHPFDKTWSSRLLKLEKTIKNNTPASRQSISLMLQKDIVEGIFPRLWRITDTLDLANNISDPKSSSKLLFSFLKNKETEFNRTKKGGLEKFIHQLQALIDSTIKLNIKGDLDNILNDYYYLLIIASDDNKKQKPFQKIDPEIEKIPEQIDYSKVLKAYKYFNFEDPKSLIKNEEPSSIFNLSRFNESCYEFGHKYSKLTSPLQKRDDFLLKIINESIDSRIEHYDLILARDDLILAREFINDFKANNNSYNFFTRGERTHIKRNQGPEAPDFNKVQMFYDDTLKHFNILLPLSNLGSTFDSFYLTELKKIIKDWVSRNEKHLNNWFEENSEVNIVFDSLEADNYFKEIKTNLTLNILKKIDHDHLFEKSLAEPLPSPEALLIKLKSDNTSLDKSKTLLERLKAIEKEMPHAYNKLIIEAKEHISSIVLENKNKELEVARTRLNKMIQQSTHTFANTISPERLNKIFQKINNYDELKNESFQIYEAYQSELFLQRQNQLLQVRYTSTENARFQLIMREGPVHIEHNNAQNIQEILDYALNRALYRLLFDSTSNYDSIRADIPLLNSNKLTEVISSFEESIILNQGSKTPNIDWCNTNFLPIIIKISSALWEQVAIERHSISCAFFYGHFSEILLNSFKYADHSKKGFLNITLGEEKIHEDGVLLTLKFSNSYYAKKSIAGMEEGLNAIDEDLLQLNERAKNAETTNKYLTTSIQNGSYTLSYKLKQDFLIKQEFEQLDFF